MGHMTIVEHDSPLTLRGGLCGEDIKCAICFQIVFYVNHFLLNFLNIFWVPLF